MVSARNTVIVAAVAAVAVLLALYVPLPGQNATSSKLVYVGSGCQASKGYVTIIQDSSGFNGSVGHGAPRNPWPVITVHRGETVSLLVCNLDRVEAHGFAIDHYFDGGVTLRPGDAYRFTFVADRTGSFTVFCNVFCTVHIYMRAALIVLPS